MRGRSAKRATEPAARQAQGETPALSLRAGCGGITALSLRSCNHLDVSEDAIEISLIWPDIQAQPVRAANQFVIQTSFGPDGKPEAYVVAIGYAAPPFILGTPEEQHASMRALGAVESTAIARVAISPAKFREFVGLLTTHLARNEGGDRDA